jgi:hypothetical protein
MSDQNDDHTRKLADEIADHLVTRQIDALCDPKVVDRITEAWAGSLDKMLGRGIRKIFFAVMVGVILFAAVKFEVLGKLLGIR